MNGERGSLYVCDMTIREKIAAMAMQGILTNRGMVDQLDRASMKWVAEHAIVNADALLAELAKPQEVSP